MICLISDLSKCVPNKTEDFNIHAPNLITGINQSKILTKFISCRCECKFDGKKCDPNQKWNNDECWCECKNLEKHHVCKKDYIWNPTTSSYENGKYLASIIDDSMIKSKQNYSNKFKWKKR